MGSRTTLEAAARAEHAAGTSLLSAEQRYRMAWWRTTLELAKLDSRTDEARAHAEAGKILHQGRDGLAARRTAGCYLASLEGDGLETLPPALAMAYVAAGADPYNAVTYLKGAEARGITPRELAAELAGAMADAP